MKSIRFEKVDNFIIFGGGELIVDICSILKRQNKQIVVLTSKQQSEDLVFKNIYSLKDYLKKYKIKFKVLKNINNLNKFNFINKNSIGISNSCRWIFKKRDIKLFKNRLINIHYSNLPSFRGAGGLSWNILTNNFISGTTIHLIDEKIDDGKYLIKKSFKFPLQIQKSLKKMQKYSIKYQKKIVKKFLLDLLREKSFKNQNIIKKNSFYWPKLDTKNNAWINWSWDSKEIVSFINSFSDPYLGAATTINNKIIRLKDAKLANSNIKFHPYQNGLIFRKVKNKIFVASKNGGISTDISHIKNKKNYLGRRLFTSNKQLENSFQNSYKKTK
tara:strand:- start:2334 stop:3320 length:987 start_codon:yes stop_codon:yes gene_type:complete